MALRSRETLNVIICSGIWGPTRHLSLKITKSLAIFRLTNTTENLNQVGRPRDLTPGPPECESRALPRSNLARFHKSCFSAKMQKQD